MKLNINKLGIIGGGQLGMFLAKAAQDINIETHVYSNTKDAPAKNMLQGCIMDLLKVLRN